MALRVGFEQGFPGLDHYWCRHTSPHEVSGAQCLSRRLILAVFQLVFVFRLGGPTPSEAAGGRPLTEKSKTDKTDGLAAMTVARTAQPRATVFVRSEKSNALVGDGVLQPAPRGQLTVHTP